MRSTVYAMVDAVSKADTPTAAPTPHTSAPVFTPRAVANPCFRPWPTAERRTIAVSRPGTTVSSPATAANEATSLSRDIEVVVQALVGRANPPTRHNRLEVCVRGDA